MNNLTKLLLATTLFLVSFFLTLLVIAVVFGTDTEEESNFSRGYELGWTFAELMCDEGKKVATPWLEEVKGDITLKDVQDPRFEAGVEEGMRDQVYSLTGTEFNACID